MSSIRLDVERDMGLKFPERNGEAVVRFEESIEIPKGAETLMRGIYRDPDRVRQSFKRLHQETSSMIELLMPRRSRLREWADSLPERPKDVESFLKETADQFVFQEQRLNQIERELLEYLQESGLEDIYPIPITAFGICTYREPCVKLFLKPLGRFAELFGINPDTLRQVVRVHFLFLLLLVTGKDLDGQVYSRGGEDKVNHWLITIYTLRYLKHQPGELTHCYREWVNAWGGKIPSQSMLDDHECEKTRAAMVFWRRHGDVSWEECWHNACQFERMTRERPTVFT